MESHTARVNEELRSILLGTAGLDLVAAVALVLTVRRRLRSVSAIAESRVAGWFVGCVALQFAHFAEEFIKGFHLLFPGMLGLAPWPGRFFVNFNLAGLAVCLFSVPLVRRGVRPAFFPVWFLALAAMVNGVAHPLLALAAGGYFPGLWTAPVLGLAGLMLWRRLRSATTVAAGWASRS